MTQTTHKPTIADFMQYLRAIGYDSFSDVYVTDRGFYVIIDSTNVNLKNFTTIKRHLLNGKWTTKAVLSRVDWDNELITENLLF